MRSLLQKRRGLSLALTLTALAVAAVWSLTGVESRAHEDHGAWLGVHLEEEIDHDEGGARIVSVMEDSPAERAGLEEGDVIVRFDGKTVRGPRALGTQVDERRPGDRVGVVVLRNGREREIDVELGDAGEFARNLLGEDFGERISEQIRESLKGLRGLEGLKGLERLEGLEGLENFEFDFRGLHEGLEGLHEGMENFHFTWQDFRRPMLGVSVSETTPELRRHLGGDDDAGVLVSKVHEDSPAEDAGIRVGDLIVAVDGEPVARSGEIRRALRDRAGETVRVDVVRDGSSVSLSVSLPELSEPDPAAQPSRHRGLPPAARDALRAATAERNRVMRQARSAAADALVQARAVQATVRKDAVASAQAAVAEALALSRETTRSALEDARRALEEAQRIRIRRSLKDRREVTLL
jgi:membrane-associated protease RseP (regulator of RpoE activity)